MVKQEFDLQLEAVRLVANSALSMKGLVPSHLEPLGPHVLLFLPSPWISCPPL